MQQRPTQRSTTQPTWVAWAVVAQRTCCRAWVWHSRAGRLVCEPLRVRRLALSVKPLLTRARANAARRNSHGLTILRIVTASRLCSPHRHRFSRHRTLQPRVRVSRTGRTASALPHCHHRQPALVPILLSQHPVSRADIKARHPQRLVRLCTTSTLHVVAVAVTSHRRLRWGRARQRATQAVAPQVARSGQRGTRESSASLDFNKY